MGTGKIVSQSVPKYPENKANNDFTLQKVGLPRNNSNKSLESHDRQQNASGIRPRLVQNPSSNSMHTVTSPGGIPPQSASAVATAAINGHGSGYIPQVSTPPNQLGHHHNPGTEPLKQLRASTDDSCLKILQQAMKRHHIPREDWSRYVLVICYGDKERILKLAEKPVVIFKELLELGKHPAIMLRQLADSSTDDSGPESAMYNDARIGTEIPGGTL